jgi:hypothetical protein
VGWERGREGRKDGREGHGRREKGRNVVEGIKAANGAYTYIPPSEKQDMSHGIFAPYIGPGT